MRELGTDHVSQLQVSEKTLSTLLITVLRKLEWDTIYLKLSSFSDYILDNKFL